MTKEEREEFLSLNETKANGFYTRDLGTPIGILEDLKVPRTRDGNFHSKLLPYRNHNIVELGELVQALFVSGLSTRKISRVLEVLYKMKISPQTASRMANIAVEEITQWRMRELEEYYPVVFIDATFFPVRRDKVEKEPVYVALGIRKDGRREILGYWHNAGGESSNLWSEYLGELHGRGLRDIKLVVGDGLSGLENAVKKVYPKSIFQSCILHAVKSTLLKIRVRDRALFADDLKIIYKALKRDDAKKYLGRLKAVWGSRYPKVVGMWEENFIKLTNFMEFPARIRSMIYTTNQLERLMKEIKRRLKVMEILPSESSAEKILYMILREENEKYLKRKLRGFEGAFDEEENEGFEQKVKLAQTQLT